MIFKNRTDLKVRKEMSGLQSSSGREFHMPWHTNHVAVLMTQRSYFWNLESDKSVVC